MEDAILSFRYFTTKYLSHRSTCYLRAKFLPYKARFEYQKWVHLKNHPPTRKKCAEIILFGCLFLFEFWM